MYSEIKDIVNEIQKLTDPREISMKLNELNETEKEAAKHFLLFAGREIKLSPGEIEQIKDHYEKIKKGEVEHGMLIEYLDEHRGASGKKHAVSVVFNSKLDIWRAEALDLIW